MTPHEQRLREFAAWLIESQEAERASLARRLHDGPVQDLTAVSMELSWFASQKSRSTEDLEERLGSAVQVIGQAIQALRELGVALRPGTLDFGLQAALECHARDFEVRTGIPCEVRGKADDDLLSAHATTEIFRMFQQVLNHIDADRLPVKIAATLAIDGEDCILEVFADGPERPHDDNSLRAMRQFALSERTALLGGVLLWEQTPEHSNARLTVPMHRAAQHSPITK